MMDGKHPAPCVLLIPGAPLAGHLAESREQGAEGGDVPVNHKVEQCGPSQLAGRLQLARNELPGPINHSWSLNRSKGTARGSCRAKGEQRDPNWATAPIPLRLHLRTTLVTWPIEPSGKTVG